MKSMDEDLEIVPFFKNIKAICCQKVLEFKSVFSGHSIEKVHARAISVSEGIVYVGGAEGNVSFTHFKDLQSDNMNFPGVEDFRDIYVNTMGACLLMNSGEKGIIWGISPGGFPQKVLDTNGVFLDGMDFWENESNGIVYGDPIGGKFFLAKTTDMGRTWNSISPKQFPNASENEGGFAGSGTGIQAIGDSTVYFGTGGSEGTARLFCSHDQGETWVAKNTPMKSDKSHGIYSIYFWTKNEGIIIGGSYIDSTYNDGICYFTEDGGESWEDRTNELKGYCSCVQGNKDGSLLVATGRVGTFYSLDKGETWLILTEKAYYSCNITEEKIILSGKNGILEFFDFKIVSTDS